jgi:hypothetical protein
MVLCIGFICVLNSKDATVAALIGATVLNRTGYSFALLFVLDLEARWDSDPDKGSTWMNI